MSNVSSFGGVTTLDLPPDQVLDSAKGEVDIAIVVGRTHGGKLYFASSEGAADVTLLWLELAKQELMAQVRQGT